VGVRTSTICAAIFLACSALAPSALAVGVSPGRAVSVAPSRSGAASSGGAADQAPERAPRSPLIAPPSACPGQSRLAAPAPAQEETMRCMTNFARGMAGLKPLRDNDPLYASSGEKAEDILRCDSFSHFACGRDFYFWIQESGYMTGSCMIGENIAFGEAAYGAVGSIFRAWMRSPTHRENILSDFDDLGVSLRVGTLDGRSGVRVWVQHFGGGCEGAEA
jgi:uncharacterized protein YkwD